MLTENINFNVSLDKERVIVNSHNFSINHKDIDDLLNCLKGIALIIEKTQSSSNLKCLLSDILFIISENKKEIENVN